MAISEADEKMMADAAETAGWRRRDLNGVTVWTLRGFDGIFSLSECMVYICQGWAAQRLADLVKPWWKDRSVWLTILASSGGLMTAVTNELVGSQNHVLSAAGMMLASMAPFISNFIHKQAQEAAVLDMRKADTYWAAQPPPKTLGPPAPAPVEPPK